ncbi:hypothetical protein LTR47_005669 [Exophiala xenobiotica]|nr:hypothetical protein LTR47_005669 [Exophiala xenobiotica]KAK5250753.1 hypothetical protein LTS06_004461 [Exophiala xenobiotica]KAK5280187.1 hypothetical protein LTR40_006719 [Exophiala xenobiotica]KAK5374259.1 hypothetical protein LTR11_005466 [Exophiala xenobiotica]
MAPSKTETETMAPSEDSGSGGNNYIWLIFVVLIVLGFIVAGCWGGYRRWYKAAQRKHDQAILDAELQAERAWLAQHPPTYSPLPALPSPAAAGHRGRQRHRQALRTSYRQSLRTTFETEIEAEIEGQILQRPPPTHLPLYSELDPQGQPPAYNENGNDNVSLDLEEGRQALREGAASTLARVYDRNSRSRDSFLTGRWHMWRGGSDTPRTSFEDIELAQMRPASS